MNKIFLSLLLIFGPGLAAAPDPAAVIRLERDLGHGLVYFRVQSLPADLPVASARHGASILDLRYVHAEPGATAALAGWLKSHCSAPTPVFVLLNARTDPAIFNWFASRDPIAGLLTLGAGGSGFVPDIVLKIHPAAERTAYEALAHGMTVDSLLKDTLDKPRHDEASIAQERTAAADESADSDTDIGNPGEAPPVVAAPPPPVIDYALLRAVQLHHALLALKKI